MPTQILTLSLECAQTKFKKSVKKCNLTSVLNSNSLYMITYMTFMENLAFSKSTIANYLHYTPPEKERLKKSIQQTEFKIVQNTFKS